MEEPKEICRHCKREVIKKSLVLHEVHCERHITLCPDCKEPVKKDELEIHKNEAHALVLCTKCKTQVEKHKLEAHEVDDCPSRLIQCEYCEVDCKASNLEAHQEACGSRTEECPTCQNLILICMLKTHMALHEKKSVANLVHAKSSRDYVSTAKHNPPKESAVKFRNMTVQNMLSTHPHVAEQELAAAHSFSPFEALDSLSESASGVSNTLAGDFPKVACEMCNMEVNLLEINDHEHQCCQYLQEYLGRDPISNLGKEPAQEEDEELSWSRYETRVVERSAPPAESWVVDADEVSIPCEICGTLFPRDCLELHQIACKFGETTISTVSPPQWEPVQPEPAASTSFDESELPSDIPCEICGALISVNIINLHEIGCRKERVHLQSAKNRSANYPEDTFSRIFDSPNQEMKKPTKPKPINNRIENPIQREKREKTLNATENRKETNPQKPIRQSAYSLIRLPDGSEILKKNVLTSDAPIDVGHVLGRAEGYDSGHFQPNQDIPCLIPHQVNRFPAVPAKAARAESRPSSLTKKPNTFKHYAYQPDPGHVLGGRSNLERPRVQDPFHGRHLPRGNEQREAPRDRAGKPPPTNSIPPGDDYKGAKPKRPAYR